MYTKFSLCCTHNFHHTACKILIAMYTKWLEKQTNDLSNLNATNDSNLLISSPCGTESWPSSNSVTHTLIQQYTYMYIVPSTQRERLGGHSHCAPLMTLTPQTEGFIHHRPSPYDTFSIMYLTSPSPLPSPHTLVTVKTRH